MTRPGFADHLNINDAKFETSDYKQPVKLKSWTKTGVK